MSINTLTHIQDGINAHLMIGCDSIQGKTGTFGEITVTTLTATNIINPTFSDAILSVGGSVTNGDLLKYADTTGLLAEDSGILASNVQLLSSPMVVPKYNMTAGTPVTNTVTPTSLLSGVHVGSLTLATGTIHLGDTVKFHVVPFISAIITLETVRLDLNCNGSSIWNQSFTNVTSALTNLPIIIDIQITNNNNSTSYISSTYFIGGTFYLESTTISLNTTISNVFDFLVTWGSANPGDIILCNSFRIDLEQF